MTPELTIYIKMGAIGLTEERQETFTITWDPNISDEQNQAIMLLRAQVMQARLQANMLEILAAAGPEFLKAFGDED